MKTVNANIQLANGLSNNLAKNMLTLRRIQICVKSSCTIMILLGKEYANGNDKVLMHFSIEQIEKRVNDLNLRRAGD